MAVHKWQCGNGHVFEFGNEDWHDEVKQFNLEDEAPVPMYCTESWDETDPELERYEGEPCLNSFSLIDLGAV